jgi:hypothetical protein
MRSERFWRSTWLVETYCSGSPVTTSRLTATTCAGSSAPEPPLRGEYRVGLYDDAMRSAIVKGIGSPCGRGESHPLKSQAGRSRGCGGRARVHGASVLHLPTSQLMMAFCVPAMPPPTEPALLAQTIDRFSVAIPHGGSVSAAPLPHCKQPQGFLACSERADC